MYKCEDLKIKQSSVEANYGIEYVGVRAFIEDNRCDVHCILEDINDCSIIQAFAKFEERKKKDRETYILKKKLGTK